jgi:hypothetical protein
MTRRPVSAARDRVLAAARPATGRDVKAQITLIPEVLFVCTHNAGRSRWRYLDWDLPDPAGLTVEQVAPIRAEISARVRALLGEMEGPGRGGGG